MLRILMAAAIALGAAGPALADSVSVGYSTVPFTVYWVSEDIKTGYQTQEDEAYTGGTLQVLYTCERQLGENTALTLTTGFGLPMSAAKHELTKEYTGDMTGETKDDTNEGDYIEVGLATIPILVGVNFEFPHGNNAFNAGIAAGAGVVAGHVKMVRVNWTGTPEIEDETNTGYIDLYMPTLMVLANLGYSIQVTDNSRLGIKIPLGFYGSSRGFEYYEEEDRFGVPVGDLSESEEGVKIGGLTYGAHVVWSRDF